MPTLSLRMEKEDLEFLKEYSNINNINMSSFVRNLILDKIYDEITEDAAEDVVIGDDVDEIPMGAIEQDIDNDTEESLNDEIKEAELKESYTL